MFLSKQRPNKPKTGQCFLLAKFGEFGIVSSGGSPNHIEQLEAQFCRITSPCVRHHALEMARSASADRPRDHRVCCLGICSHFFLFRGGQ
jgi:hypothetical protein